MKSKRHSPEQIIVKLRQADALLSTGATLGQVSHLIFSRLSENLSWREHRVGSAPPNQSAEPQG